MRSQLNMSLCMTKPSRPAIDELVSIVIPTYNRRTLIKDALASIAAQSWGSIEVIVIDDGSDDGTGAMIAGLADSGFPWPITYRWQHNTGPGPARNHGRCLAQGTYLYHLDSDDVMEPDALSDLIGAMQSAEVPFAVGLVANTDLAGMRDQLEPLRRPCLLADDIVGSGWYTHAALYRRDLIDAVGGYNQEVVMCEDTELHWRILEKAGLPALSETVVGTRRIHKHGHLSAGNAGTKNIRFTLALFEHMQSTQSAIFATGRNTLRVFLLGIDFGARADWEHRDRAVSLLCSMLASHPFVVKLVRLTLKPNLAGYYRALRTGAAFGRRIFQPLFKRGALR